MTDTSLPTPVAAPRLFPVPSVEEFAHARDAVIETLASDDVALLRGLVDPEDVRRGLDRIAGSMSRENDSLIDHKSRVERPGDVPNYQRFMLGEHGEGEAHRSMCMRIFHNPSWNGDEWGMKETFHTMARIRNALYGVDSEYCIEEPDGDVYSLFRVHQYPAGGGFLAPHRDSVASAVPDAAGLTGYVQLLLVMSRKGEDFEQGGGFYYRGEERVLYEDYAQPGDILLYNGQTLHGVQTVDPYTTFDPDSAAGRYSATCTLYRVRRGQMTMG